MQKYLVALALTLALPLFQNCGSSYASEDQFDPPTIAKLQALHSELVQASNRSCSMSSDCEVIVAGDRPCGGPSKYYVYSSSTSNVPEIERLASEFTSLQQSMNEATNAVGTCEALDVPSVVSCINYQCTPSW